ncbi:hypothetical protein F0562_006151 [Nyssa sinensis]|uniref:Uncharacterized protein n=1 Tax=Nyssa sinensis TaxID=561372 RepID=A0A5J5AP45_9ASTE|nr:hypothetical protein F0562_006151 [Nyssa sinensis]
MFSSMPSWLRLRCWAEGSPCTRSLRRSCGLLFTPPSAHFFTCNCLQSFKSCVKLGWQKVRRVRIKSQFDFDIK